MLLLVFDVFIGNWLALNIFLHLKNKLYNKTELRGGKDILKMLANSSLHCIKNDKYCVYAIENSQINLYKIF